LVTKDKNLAGVVAKIPDLFLKGILLSVTGSKGT